METRGGQASIDPDQALPLPVRIVTRLLVALAILDWLRALAEQRTKGKSARLDAPRQGLRVSRSGLRH